MSDLNHHDDEEYHFDDSESFDFGEHDNTAEEEFIGDEDVIEDVKTKGWENERAVVTPNKASSTNMKKKIVMGVGVVVLLVAGYYLMTPHGQGSNTSTAIPSATQKNNVPAEPPVPAVTAPVGNNTTATNQTVTNDTTANATSDTALDSATDDAWLGSDDNTITPPNNATASLSNAPAATTAVPASTSSDVPNDDSMQMQLQTLNMQNQTLTLKLQQVTAQSEAAAARAASLEKTVAQLQTQMTKMNQMLQGGTITQNAPPPLTRTPARTAAAATPTPTRTADSSGASQSKSAVAYYVQAIIPGRAWIGDSNGHIVTVALGDRLEALNSTVKDIDPINGIVTLSNGRQIEYGMVAQ